MGWLSGLEDFGIWFLRTIKEQLVKPLSQLISDVIHLATGTPAPGSVDDMFQKPDSPMWKAVYEVHHGEMMDIAMMTLALGILLSFVFGALKPAIGKPKAQRAELKMLMAIVFAKASWFMGSALLHTTNSLALLIQPSPDKISSTMMDPQGLLATGAATVVFAILTAIISNFALLGAVLMYSLRNLLIQGIMMVFPLLWVLWAFPVDKVSRAASKTLNFFLALSLMTLPNAVLFRVAYLYFNNANMASIGGIIKLAMVLVVPMAVLFTPKYLTNVGSTLNRYSSKGASKAQTLYTEDTDVDIGGWSSNGSSESSSSSSSSSSTSSSSSSSSSSGSSSSSTTGGGYFASTLDEWGGEDTNSDREAAEQTTSSTASDYYQSFKDTVGTHGNAVASTIGGRGEWGDRYTDRDENKRDTVSLNRGMNQIRTVQQNLEKGLSKGKEVGSPVASKVKGTAGTVSEHGREVAKSGSEVATQISKAATRTANRELGALAYDYDRAKEGVSEVVDTAKESGKRIERGIHTTQDMVVGNGSPIDAFRGDDENTVYDDPLSGGTNVNEWEDAQEDVVSEGWIPQSEHEQIVTEDR